MADITYRQLKAAVTALGKDVARGAEAIQARAEQIAADARDTARLAELIASMGVDQATVAETSELAKNADGVSQASLAYAAAGDTTARAMRAAYDQAHASHDGINEAVARSTVDVSGLNREWLRQE